MITKLPHLLHIDTILEGLQERKQLYQNLTNVQNRCNELSESLCSEKRKNLFLKEENDLLRKMLVEEQVLEEEIILDDSDLIC